MALPWHGDTARCRAGYDAQNPANYGEYTPAYWPARVPNHVLTFQDYLTVIGPRAPPTELRPLKIGESGGGPYPPIPTAANRARRNSRCNI
ncbi:hypothetical protein HED52_04165 [Ochrobactrum ciceri]|uniref:Uncharacterized protein n=1 Tax=Brucella ciceri TaxID=391287 RepID=A0ABX1DYJ8_9HYPH|nr:hypothetical protein [Brucella ciceri]